ncbi:hypothetical protein BOS5A_110589 [Bosea sp. EC-HK365B]|nr:hypothetical protein BOSE21B_110120 [Bosea sp. 21B]CAD5283190.1 hypothetical protein BOSE7B_41093 [Bosea sp. 7B]VVT52168.1 hypothetical protein BOS5A_110589 [Bosea sp. EC-HK365B]VXC89376.1 hypothetical protein BOSE127_70138 [Bosea sp. 127]
MCLTLMPGLATSKRLISSFIALMRASKTYCQYSISTAWARAPAMVPIDMAMPRTSPRKQRMDLPPRLVATPARMLAPGCRTFSGHAFPALIRCQHINSLELV